MSTNPGQADAFPTGGPPELAEVASILNRLIPLARKIGILHTDEGPGEILKRAIANRYTDLEDEFRDPKYQATFLLEVVVLSSAFALKAFNADPNGEWRDIAYQAKLGAYQVWGYMSALDDVRAGHVRRGANGRRLIGASSRESVRRAASPMRGLMSKESAAPKIASMVGKSPATVRKMLTEMFPGTTWTDLGAELSTDKDG